MKAREHNKAIVNDWKEHFSQKEIYAMSLIGINEKGEIFVFWDPILSPEQFIDLLDSVKESVKDKVNSTKEEAPIIVMDNSQG